MAFNAIPGYLACQGAYVGVSRPRTHPYLPLLRLPAGAIIKAAAVMTFLGRTLGPITAIPTGPFPE